MHGGAILIDALERAAYPYLEELGTHQPAKAMRSSATAVREAMAPIYEAVSHTMPANVRAHDPEGFEADLERLCTAVRQHLDLQASESSELASKLSPRDRREMQLRLLAQLHLAASHPRPMKKPLQRVLSRLVTRIERSYPDAADDRRPGRDRLAS